MVEESFFYRLVVAYDGTRFHGWQENAEVRTVQGELRNAAAVLSENLAIVEGSSRTDTGVHALGHLARVQLDRNHEPDELQKSLQGITPDDIEIVSCERTSAEWHPRFNAVAKRYLYRIWNGPRKSLFEGETSWWIRADLDIEAMHQAGQTLVGRHDFASFRTRSKDEPEDTVRTIHELKVHSHGQHILIQVVGDGFLYRMVRNITGTLVDVGRGQISGDQMSRILEAADRREAGITAPPEGLFLVEVSTDSDRALHCTDTDPFLGR